MTTVTADRADLASALMPFATFSVTGGLAADYVKRGEMVPWQGILAVEGIETGDRRIIAPDALTWRELPLPMMYQFENPVGGSGHDGATLSARIDEIVRIDEGRIWARGFIDPTTRDGDDMVMAMDKGLIRGVSVDLDMVMQVDVEGSDGLTRTVITSARIAGATVCPFQAFMEAQVFLDAELLQLIEENRAIAASADMVGTRAMVWLPIDPIETMLADYPIVETAEAIVAAAARPKSHPIPVDPPSPWFEYGHGFEHNKPSGLVPFTITANGRVFGHVAAWGTCHISFSNRCVPVPRSATKYSKFRCGSVLTAEGTTIRTGPIVMDTVHPDLRWRAGDAMRFYADTGAAMCDVVPYEDEFGIYIAGAVRPDVSPARLRALRGSDISPDWRMIDGNPHEMCAMLAVNNSGYKLPIALAASAGLYIEPGETAFALDEHQEVYALVASGPLGVEEPCEHCAVEDDIEGVVEPADVEAGLAKFDARFTPKVFRRAAPPAPTVKFRRASR